MQNEAGGEAVIRATTSHTEVVFLSPPSVGPVQPLLEPIQGASRASTLRSGARFNSSI